MNDFVGKIQLLSSCGFYFSEMNEKHISLQNKSVSDSFNKSIENKHLCAG